MSRRRVLLGLVVGAALVLGTPAVWAAVHITTASRAVVAQTGSLRFWDMTQGTLTTWDSAAQWGTGTFASTSATAIPDTLTLRTSGPTPPTSRPWWNQSWSTRQCFTVPGTGVAQVARQITLVFDTTDDIANGWMQATGNDLRAIDNDNATQLSMHLVSGINTAATTVNVVANVPAAGTTVCLYSGNPTAPSVSAPIVSIVRVDTGTGSAAAPSGWLNDAAVASWLSATPPTSNLTTANTITVAASATGVPAAVFANAKTWTANNANAGPMIYTIPGYVAGSTATIVAYYAESWNTNRRFRVRVNGVATADNNFRISTTAGGTNIGIGRTYTATVGAGGTFTLELDKIGNGVDRDPLISGFSVSGTLAASALTGTALAAEGLYAQSGTWESPVIDSGPGTAIYGALFGDPLAPTLASATYQIAGSNSPTGPWSYVGPTGTAASIFTGAQEASPTSIDGLRYSRIRVTLSSPSRLSTPTIGQLSLRSALPVLARAAGGRSTQTAAPLATVLKDDGSWVATQSSTAFGGPPERAIDGVIDGVYNNGSIPHTGYATGSAGPPQTDPWWQVDLGRSQVLSSVRLWNRTDCCDTRAVNATVFVSDIPFSSPASATPGVLAVSVAGPVGRATQVTVGRTGRYVRIQLAGAQFLHLAEVEPVAPVALLTKITGAETGLVALSDSLVHESTSGASLTTNVRLGSSHQIRLASAAVTLAGAPVAHSTTPMLISATGQLPGTGQSATHNFTFRGIWTSEQLRIERPMSVVWVS